MTNVLRIFVIVLCALTVAPQATAQISNETELRAEQRRLYDLLLQEPADVDLMFEHVAVSIRLQDYEAAISTLERMLIYRRDLSRVRLELGAAYFNLGSYAVSQHYFSQALEDAELAPEARERVGLYLAEIKARTDRSSISVIANAGVTYATNANLGPLDDDVVVGGMAGFELAPDDQSQSDFGMRTTITGTHIYDLRQPNTNAWVTDFNFFGLRYFDVNAGNTLFARVRTGPRLALNEEQAGPKLRPYVDGKYLNVDDSRVFWNGGAGAEYTQSINDDWAAFADLGGSYYDLVSERNREDNLSLRLIGGGAYFPSRDIIGRVSGYVERDFAAADFWSNFEIGIHASADFQYDSGISGVDRKWAVSVYADARYRWYDDADPFIDAGTTRNDREFGVGVGHLFAIRDGFGLKFDVEAFKRNSNIKNFDLENLNVTLSAQKRF